MPHHILSINPGSTSTKIAFFEDEQQLFSCNIEHSADELKIFGKVTDQFEFRKTVIIEALDRAGIDWSGVEAIVGRGGMVKPVESGVYEMNDRLREDLIAGIQGEHASSLGGLIAEAMAASIPGAKAYIADPVVVDELQDVARISGHPLFHRKSLFHALNHKAIGRMHAKAVGRKYEDLNLIIAHLGGGISVGAHCRGKVIDVNDGINGTGPFSPTRAGELAAADVARLCFDGKHTLDDLLAMINGHGGVMAWMGTNDLREVVKRGIEGDRQSLLIAEALAYNVAKEIGSMAAVLEGKADAILLTGGIANNQFIVNYIMRMIAYIAPVHIYPGEDEMAALAMNGLAVLRGEACKVYC
jgi:butyrate kinase